MLVVIRVKFSSTIFEISVSVTNASGIRSVGYIVIWGLVLKPLKFAL